MGTPGADGAPGRRRQPRSWGPSPWPTRSSRMPARSSTTLRRHGRGRGPPDRRQPANGAGYWQELGLARRGHPLLASFPTPRRGRLQELKAAKGGPARGDGGRWSERRPRACRGRRRHRPGDGNRPGQGGRRHRDRHRRPPAVPRALRLGRSTLTAIRQNLFWAFAYNTAGNPRRGARAFRPFGPMIAALAMSLSSVTVVARSSLLAKLRLDQYACAAVSMLSHATATLPSMASRPVAALPPHPPPSVLVLRASSQLYPPRTVCAPPGSRCHVLCLCFRCVSAFLSFSARSPPGPPPLSRRSALLPSSPSLRPSAGVVALSPSRRLPSVATATLVPRPFPHASAFPPPRVRPSPVRRFHFPPAPFVLSLRSSCSSVPLPAQLVRPSPFFPCASSPLLLASPLLSHVTCLPRISSAPPRSPLALPGLTCCSASCSAPFPVPFSSLRRSLLSLLRLVGVCPTGLLSTSLGPPASAPHFLPSLPSLRPFGPMIAAVAMSLSSVTVVARSSLLAKLKLDR